MESIRVERPPMKLIKDLAKLSSATAWGALNQTGISSTFMKGIFPLTSGVKMVGPAQTLHYVPMREDKKYTPEWFRTSAPFRVANETKEGDVIVVESLTSRSY